MSAPYSVRPERLAREGLFSAFTMLTRRRAGRAKALAEGPAGLGTALRNEQLGFVVRLPAGWVRQHGDVLLVDDYGLVTFQDVVLLTPTGMVVRIGVALEPRRPDVDAVNDLPSLHEGLRSEELGEPQRLGAAEAKGFEALDLAYVRQDRRTLVRLGIAGRRVVCIEASVERADDARAVIELLDGFELLRGEAWEPEARTSGTYSRTNG